ncbi:SseB family protein [Streptomyces sp. NPDC001604]|uniref:SseB family protein n=1 Tax=Streptomyces sp. NPDC001604 TaxID=3364593 RepID=UPI0036986328
MTDYSSDGSAPAVHQALRAVVGGDADEAELNTLAGSEVLVPAGSAASQEQDPSAVTLPVYAQEDGTELVPVFTTENRLQSALPQVTQHRRIALGTLARRWPSETLALVIDVGTPEEVALTAAGVRQLLDRGAA